MVYSPNSLDRKTLTAGYQAGHTSGEVRQAEYAKVCASASDQMIMEDVGTRHELGAKRVIAPVDSL